MKNTDKVLVGIVAGIVVLVIAALVAVLAGPKPEYKADDSPESVAHNYLLALQNMDYKRAYSYLSQYLIGYPYTQDKFNKNIQDYARYFRTGESVTLSVEKAVVMGKTAIVTINESRFQGGNLFSSSQRQSVFEMKVLLEGDKWKVSYASNYFVPCWDQAGGCK